MNVNAPYSQCDAKGRCIRHPTIQMSRKKKLGGWKKLLSLCPMCAMELMTSNDGNIMSADQFCGEVSPSDQRQQRGMEPPSHHSDSVSLHSTGSNNHHHDNRRNSTSSSHRRPHPSRHADDRSVAHSVRSAPSTYNRRDSQETKHSSSDSSCDTTVDMSHSSEYSSSGHNASSPRSGSGGLRRSNSRGSVQSYGSQRSGYSHGSARSSGSRTPRSPRVGHQEQAPATAQARGGYNPNVNTIDQNQEAFVCGMEFDGMFYTGQIHVESQLPHGLGTLRSDVDGSVAEGQWRFGRLVQEGCNAAPSQGYQEEEEEYDSQEYGEQQQQQEYHCLPCAESQPNHQQLMPPPPPPRNIEENLCNDFSRYNPIQGTQSQEDGVSSASNSIAETIHDEDTLSESSSEWSRNAGYSARESKFNGAPRSHRSDIVAARVSYNKLQEFERYVERCDDDEDYYTSTRDVDGSGRSGSGFNASHASMGSYERQKKVRFMEDP